jgi:hypothetical protein
MAAQVKVKLVPWDDRDFVAAFEAAAADLAAQGLQLDTGPGSLALQRELRARGYPDATAYCERTVDEVFANRLRCVVMRDGQPAVAFGEAPAT